MDFLIAMDPAVKCLLLLLVVAILFVTEKIPLAVTSIASAVCCWLLGLVPLKEVFLGLADSTVVLFGGMFVVGAAMIMTPIISFVSLVPKTLTIRAPISWARPV